MRRRDFLVTTGLAVGLAIAPAWGQERLPVVATFSILGDITARIGGERIAVRTLVGPGGDAHTYQPSPTDARGVAQARLLVTNGLGMEGWIDRLARASDFKGQLVVASAGVALQSMAEEEEEGGVGRMQRKRVKPTVVSDPHAWQSLANGERYARNIAEALIQIDPAGAEIYRANYAAYSAELAALDGWVRGELAGVPAAKRRIITSHDAFGYFGTAYGVEFLAPVGISTEAEPSAADVARLIRQIREQGVKAIFVETITDSRLVEQIAREAGGIVGGNLYSDSLSQAGGPADSYVKMFRYNVATMKAGMLRN